MTAVARLQGKFSHALQAACATLALMLSCAGVAHAQPRPAPQAAQETQFVCDRVIPYAELAQAPQLGFRCFGLSGQESLVVTTANAGPGADPVDARRQDVFGTVLATFVTMRGTGTDASVGLRVRARRAPGNASLYEAISISVEPK